MANIARPAVPIAPDLFNGHLFEGVCAHAASLCLDDIESSCVSVLAALIHALRLRNFSFSHRITPDALARCLPWRLNETILRRGPGVCFIAVAHEVPAC